MDNTHRTKEDLLVELSALRQRVVELERSKAARTQEERKLRASERKYLDIAQNAGAVVVVGDDGKLEFVNSGAVEMLGPSRLDLSSASFTDLVHPDDRKIVAEHQSSVLLGDGISSACSFRFGRKGSGIRAVESRMMGMEHGVESRE